MGDLTHLAISPDEQPKQSSFEPLPAGTYTVVIEESEVKRNKDLTGSFLHLRMQVLDGTYAGRLLFDKMWTQHDSDKARQIGREKIVAIVRGTGASGDESSEFIGKTISAKVKIKPAKDGYDAQNEVVAYSASASAHKPKPSSAPAPAGDVVRSTTYAPPRSAAAIGSVVTPDDDNVPF